MARLFSSSASASTLQFSVLRSPSSLTVVYEHGEKLEYQTDKLSTEVLLKLFREDSSMAVIRGHCARAGLNLDDFGKPGALMRRLSAA